MQKKLLKRSLLLLFLLGIFPLLTTQASSHPRSATIVEARIVRASATDGLDLLGDFYLIDSDQPTVLLLHELYTTRASWNAFIDPLLLAGYNVLAVDLRGHGATQGAINWPQAVSDVQTWLNWLRLEAGVRADGISIMGSSMGANLAIVGCANDPLCVTAIAISPGWRYFGIGVKNAFERGLGQRPALLIYAERDRWPALGVPQMLDAATGSVITRVFPGNLHGMNLLNAESAALIPDLLHWLGAPGQPLD